MPCRRASTPAAAAAADPAVAAWPLTPLVLALAVFSAMPHVTLSQGRENWWPPLEGNSQLTTTKNLSCDEVPYPFGLKGKSAPGFRVTCRKNDSAAMLRIGHQKFRIDQVSSQEGFVVIFAGPIYRLCYDRNGRPVVGSTGIGPTNLTDTPFFFSKRNTLVATGCYSNFTATFTSSLHHHGWSTNGSCTTNGRVNSDGLCPGTACCDAYGMPLDDAQEVTFEFNKTSASVAGTCSAAFILYQKEQIYKVSGNSKPMHLHQEEHIFRAGGGDSKPVHLEDVLVPLGERRMVLDWVIGRATCKQARNNSFKTQYRCNNESSCMDRFVGEGYVCRCKAGRPYPQPTARDIKSSNILLDENLMAKISDFGASRSVPFDQTHVTTLIQGTIGYLDPEYFQSSKLTEKSDVYSFGVVLAELLTRQKPISASRPEESCNLAMYIVNLFNERRLLQEIEPHILAEAGEEQIHAVAQLSVRCLNLKGEERPVMREVASVLHGLRESFDEEQIIRRSNESIQITNGQDSVHSEARPIPSLQSSGEITTEYSLPAEILPSSYLAR
uniref:Protein kinase domain-containing protein n=1 Tax=Oryza nivara TaxID=4536 RepID=A0A0E0H5F6_ORYNI